MGVFSRAEDILQTDLEALIGQADDPGALLQRAMGEIEDTLVELKATCASLIAENKKLLREVDEATVQQKMWERRAQLAVDKERDDLAQEALWECRRFRERVEQLHKQQACTGERVEVYHERIGRLQEVLAVARTLQENLPAGKESDPNGRLPSLSLEDLLQLDQDVSVEESAEDVTADEEIERELEALKEKRRNRAS